ncbi:MAG: HugZ family pyridoxamine 5'-phosphate oxidase [Acidiferrobacterales bacterium]
MNNEVEQKITELKKRHTNIVLATIDGDGLALASQTPYALDEAGNFLILVSGLAEHGKTLRSAEAVNVMLMEDENGLANPFARERLNFTCKVEMLEPGSEGRTNGEQLLLQRFGKFVQTLIQLPDFTMFRLSPVSGRYVAGFGAAYAIENGKIRQLRG